MHESAKVKEIIWATSWETYASNKDADQPAYLRSPINVFIVHCLGSCYIKNFKTLASFCSWAGRFESYQVTNPEDKFSHDFAHLS